MATLVQPGTILAGSYEVDRLLGEGGMGIVVAARHLPSGRTVAIKLMLPMALSFPQAVQRFVREAKVLSLIDSEHVAKVLDVGVLDSGAPYFAMEYVDGVDLGKLVRQYGALSVGDAVDFVLQACAGMARAHEHGVVHRDLKPGNLLLAQRDDGSALIKVLDFGLSKVLSQDLDEGARVNQTQTTGTMGTPAYMSPEQARSARDADRRSDIWSLGAILYHLLSARLPFPAQATAEAFAKVLYEEPMPLCEAAPWVPVKLENVILRCLQKDMDRRYQRIEELISDLEPLARTGASEPASGQAGPRIVHGPRKLDVSSVLQQRTVASFEPLSLAFAGTLAQHHVTLPPPPRIRRMRKAALMALMASMLVGGGILVGAVLFAGRSTPAAATTPAAERAAPGAGQGLWPIMGMAKSLERVPAQAMPGPRPDPVPSPLPAAEPSRTAPGPVDAGVRAAGADASSAGPVAPAPHPRPGRHAGQKTPRPGPGPQKKPHIDPKDLDPFGTIH